MSLRHLVITYPFNIHSRNGATRNIFAIIRELVRMDLKVSVIYIERPSNQPHAFPYGSNSAPAPNIRLVPLPKSGRSSYADGLLVRDALETLLAREPADAVIGHYQDCGYLLPVVRRYRLVFAYISTWQSYAVALNRWRNRNFWSRWRSRWSDQRRIVMPHRAADILLASSEFTRQELIDVVGVAPEKIVVNYLGVDESFLTLPRVSRPEIRKLLFFGRLVPRKGIEDSLAALGQVAAAGQRDWHFSVHCEGKDAWVRQMAAAHRIADLVEVGPPLADAALHEVLAAADLALMPSHEEAFGLSIAESQASGLPVVAYDAGAVPEVVTHGETGWLAPVHDRTKLAAQLQEAFADPAEAFRRGLAGRKQVADRFSWPRAAQRLVTELERVKRRES
jgi:glycosyltransferase involved in cell wall biosynthesis